MRRTLWALASMTLALTLLLASAPAARASAPFPTTIRLPNGWLPEGVVTGRGPVIYAGSRASGSIYAANLRTGEGRIVVNQTGRIAVGLSFDQRSNYIFAAGGSQGTAYVYDAGSGAEVAAFTFTTGTPTFINDVIVTRDAAYFTNSSRAELYRVALGPSGRLPEGGAFTTIPLGGDWEQVQGFNANGIEATRSGDRLIVVNSTVGALYAVDPATGVADRIEVGEQSFAQGDGLLLKGSTLYVVRNRSNTIVAVRLASDLRSGEVTAQITSPLFRIPTTVASFGNALYAVNARFDVQEPGPSTEYEIVRVEP